MAIKFTFLFFFSSYLLFGQEISGRIIDEQTNEPIENVHVYLNNNTGTVSDKNGIFKLRLIIKKNATLKFSKVGYVTLKITFSDLERNGFIVLLKKKIEKINEVTVHSRKLKSMLKYTKLTSMNIGVYSLGSVIVDDKIYIIGGDASVVDNNFKKAWNETSRIIEPKFDDLYKALKKANKISSIQQFKNQIQIYDFKNDNWSISPVNIENRACHNVIFHKNKLYILGGKTVSKNRRTQYLSNKIEVLNLNTNEIKVDNTNPHQTVSFASVLYGDYIVVMGGSTKQNKNGTKKYTNKSHFYNINTGLWYELSDMTNPKETKGVIVGDKIYLIGGFNGTPLSEVESFNMTSGELKKEGNLFQAVVNPALAMHDNIIYIYNSGNLSIVNTTTNLLRSYKIDLHLKESQLQYYENSLYVIGGCFEDEFSKTPSAEIYKIDLNELEKTKLKQKILYNR